MLIACLSWENADAQRKPREVQEQAIKYQRLMQMIDAAYVDTVNLKKLTEDAIVKVLADLDPHSVYISKEEVTAMTIPMEFLLSHQNKSITNLGFVNGFFVIWCEFSVYFVIEFEVWAGYGTDRALTAEPSGSWPTGGDSPSGWGPPFGWG